MVRRVAAQVHKQVSRLKQTGYIKQEPVWYKAVLEHPPLPLPPRATPDRLPKADNGQPFDLPASAAVPSHEHLKKPPKVKAQPIVYLEDQVRRQFFRDHPFEAFRERTLVEADVIEDEHPVRGEAWTRLSQRGRNPGSEDAVRFTVNLYEHTPGMSLSQAYETACLQYQTLRFEQQVAARVAVEEAEHYGMTFKPTAIESAFEREQEHLKTWEETKLAAAESMEARKRWRMNVERPRSGPTPVWSKGEEYTRLWKQGIRPDYSPVLSAPLDEESSPAELPPEVDPMGLKPR